MLYLQLPFYGKRGSIAEIKETEKTYDVSTYNNDGKASITSKVKKTNSNLKALINNYHKDTDEYLRTNREKYDIASYEKNTEYPSAKTIKAAFITSAVLVSTAMPISALTGMAGVTVYSLVIGTPFFIASYKVLKKIDKQNKKNSFINEYKRLNKEYRKYEIEKEDEKRRTLARSKIPMNIDKERKYSYIKELVKQ